MLCNSESLRIRALDLGIAPAAKVHPLGVGSSNGADMERFAPGPTNVRDHLGIPVVTTESTGSRDSVLPEVTGLLIPPGYPEAICEAVSR